jgi:hypothetical protein
VLGMTPDDDAERWHRFEVPPCRIKRIRHPVRAI